MSKREWILLLVIMVVGVGLRLVPHAPNFSPILGMMIFAAAVFSDKKAAIGVPLVLIAGSDLILGLYDGISFVYLGYLVAALLGLTLKRQRIFPTVVVSLLASAIFFLLSNVGVWLYSGMYAQTTAGLIDCFVMAIPFFHSTAISTVVTAPLLMAIHRFAARRWVAQSAPRT